MQWTLTDKPWGLVGKEARVYPSWTVCPPSVSIDTDNGDTEYCGTCGNHHRSGQMHYDLPATGWIVEGETIDQAVENMMNALDAMLPEDHIVNPTGEEMELRILPESITRADVDKWVNEKPQADRYGNLMDDTLDALLKHVHETAHAVIDDEIKNHHGIAIDCKVNTYSGSNEFRDALITGAIADHGICSPLTLTDEEKKLVADEIIDWEDNRTTNGNFSASESAMESGWEQANTIASDIGLGPDNLFSAGRSGGYIVLPLSDTVGDWEFTEIMQYSIMAWEIAAYKRGGFEWDYAWQVCQAFEGSRREQRLTTSILSERTGHDLSKLQVN